MGPQSSTSEAPPSPPMADAGDSTQSRPGLVFWVVSIGAAVALVCGAFLFQQAQAVCGAPAEPSPAAFSASWWRCPIEQNRFNRPLAKGVQRPTLSSLHASADGKVLWAGGIEGALAKSDDAGLHWEVKRTGTEERINGIYFAADGKAGWAVGAKGVVLSTVDGGEQWQARRLPNVMLYSVVFDAARLNGWAVGDVAAVYRTVDGGVSWTPTSFNGHDYMRRVYFGIDPGKGWAVGESAVIRTLDGGASWQVVAVVDQNLNDIAMSADGVQGLAVGDGGTLLRTVDRGHAWAVQKPPVSSAIRAVYLTPSGQQGWIADTSGAILATSDGGANWSPQLAGAPGRGFNALVGNADGERAWAVGENGTVFRTVDGGKAWTRAALYSRDAPPWYRLLTALVGLECCGILGWRIHRQKVLVLTGRIAFEGIADAPLERADQDLLGFAEIADAIAAFLRHERTLPSLTIAVTAAWGQGKSSLMGLMRARLIASGGSTVWFNAWHHQKEPVMLAALLGAVVAQGIPPWLSIRGMRFRFRLVWMRFCKRPMIGVLPALIFFTGVLGILYVLLAWAMTVLLRGPTPGMLPHPVFSQVFSLAQDVLTPLTSNVAVSALLGGEWAAFARGLIGASGHVSDNLPILAAVIFLASVFLLFTHFVRPFPANPGALLYSAGTKFSLAQAEDQTTLRQRFRDHFRDVTRALQPRTLTIFIDDIDRCESAKAVEMLEAINYLADAGLCFIVIGMAREIVEGQLGEAYSTLADQTAEFEAVRQAERPAPGAAAAGQAKVNVSRQRLEFARKYLNKLIQIEVKVPTFGARQMRDLLRVEAGQADEQVAIERRARLRTHALCDQIERSVKRAMLVGRFVIALSVVSLLAYQCWLWAESQGKIDVAAMVTDRQLLADAESELTGKGRAYAAYLKALLAATTPQPAMTRTSASAKILDAGVHLTDSRLREAQRWLVQAENALDQLKQQRSHQSFAADGANAALKEARFRLGQLASEDTMFNVTRLDVGIPEFRQPRNAGSDAQAIVTDQNAKIEVAEKTIPFALIVPFAFLLAIAIGGILFGRDRYEIKESDAFKNAVLHWQPVLMARERMRAPREAKRFLNLSRYLTLRVNPDKYLGWPWWRRKVAALRKVRASAPSPQVDEPIVVALTTLLMTRPKHIQGSDIAQFLEQPEKYWETVRAMNSQDDSAYMKAAINAYVDATANNYYAAPWSSSDVRLFVAAAGELTQA